MTLTIKVLLKFIFVFRNLIIPVPQKTDSGNELEIATSLEEWMYLKVQFVFLMGKLSAVSKYGMGQEKAIEYFFL